jgi:SAM-dependent methyltransferase
VDATLVEIAEAYGGEAFSPASACPICTGDSKVAHGAFNIHPDRPRRFDLRVCDGCKHGWIDPMPSQGLLNYLYGRGSYSVIGIDWAEAEGDLTLPGRLVVARELASQRRAGRYFELGVGKGALYRKFLESGWQCTGVEPGAWGRELSGIHADIDAVPQSTAANVVVALDVLEHVADPVTMLKKIHRLAAPAARLYCAMPNRQSARALVCRSRWRMLRPLGHVNYWSRDSVVRAFAGAGFGIDDLRKSDLWEPRRIRSLRDAAGATLERLGLGDQWIVMAHRISRPD